MRSRRTLPLVVLLLAGVVYGVTGTTALQAGGKPTAATPKPAQKSAGSVTNDTLPLAVQEMREAIQTAARTGRLEELRTPIEMNELRPETGAPAGAEILEFWKTFSADGEGREIMAAMVTLLDMTPAVLPFGADIENNRLFVWPGLATRPLSALTAAEEIELLQLVPAGGAAGMKKAGLYNGWRLTIGADGTWHSFRKVPQ